MTVRHAAALALVGWYLMVPPTQEMTDPACNWHNSTFIGGITAVLRGGSDWNIVICDREALLLDTFAPLSEWDSGSAFETLAECQAEQQKPLSASEKARVASAARLAFDSDRKLRPEAASALPNDFVKLALESRETALMASQCIASDDPRLKGK
jgi:hypothetical protein